MNVPLLDLKAQYASLKDEMMPIISDVMDSQYLINGPAVKDLEAKVNEYCGTAAAIGVSSGTDALIVSLMSLGVGEDLPACRTGASCPGPAEVITTPYTFFATAGSIWRVGARPVFVDIDPVTFNMAPAQIEAAVTENTKAIMPVHLFGQCADMDPILDVAGKHNLAVIEDAAQAIGATYKGKPAGSLGTTGCFSFFPSKNLGGLGDGGMVVTQDADLGEKLRQCRNHGSKPKYFHKWVGGNFRLDTIQAAGLIVKLKYLDSWHEGRRANAATYDKLFAEVDEVTTPVIAEHNQSIYNQYVIRAARRDELQTHLKDKGVGHAIYYPLSLHEQECFAGLGYKRGDFPASEAAAAETLALPVYPEMTGEQLQYVVDQVKAFYAC
ncbi:MAG: DegT/DnrJ/EryC1/StrS family aminotransferase [Phycisphaerae bacterium]|nr:DegT/DnrJ/EryC1/StrS family aminotransferase [Phycisphaerae bacterium]